MKTTAEKLEFYHGKLDEEAKRQLEEDVKEALRDHFQELGFEKRKEYLWVHQEHSLIIELYGDFSGTFFQLVKPYYLFHKNNWANPFNGKELASGSKMEIVAAVQKLMFKKDN
ncbi:hypothetical protein ACFS7Z_22745 [Pontibacter toksunensis]|uniref:Uncharacterized protein n=1 Tax=Pontibacter toksunensis TaxID=1332631 RepID=A0ABW6C594_9BACT